MTKCHWRDYRFWKAARLAPWALSSGTYTLHLNLCKFLRQERLECIICNRKCQNNDLFHNFTTVEVWYFPSIFNITSGLHFQNSQRLHKAQQANTGSNFQIIVPRLGCQAAKPFTTSRAKTVRSLIAAKLIEMTTSRQARRSDAMRAPIGSLPSIWWPPSINKNPWKPEFWKRLLVMMCSL